MICEPQRQDYLTGLSENLTDTQKIDVIQRLFSGLPPALQREVYRCWETRIQAMSKGVAALGMKR
ncbi:MAG: hypothetical protein AAF756_02265 [Pseudomonadota bacterium]